MFEYVLRRNRYMLEWPFRSCSPRSLAVEFLDSFEESVWVFDITDVKQGFTVERGDEETAYVRQPVNSRYRVARWAPRSLGERRYRSRHQGRCQDRFWRVQPGGRESPMISYEGHASGGNVHCRSKFARNRIEYGLFYDRFL